MDETVNQIISILHKYHIDTFTIESKIVDDSFRYSIQTHSVSNALLQQIFEVELPDSFESTLQQNQIHVVMDTV